MNGSIGEVILVLRRAADISQEQLAERLGVTQAALSRYENDLRAPDDDTLLKIAEALDVTPQFLRHDFRMFGAIAADAHMRRQKTTRPADWKRIEARLNAHRMHSSYLLARTPLKYQHQVLHVDPHDTTPAEAALLLRAQWRMPIGPVRDLMRWLEAAGVFVIEEDFGTHRIDGMTQWAGEHAVIIVNGALPTDRKRWTLAHELGHLVLHANNFDADVEQQAHDFAGEFLMPEHVVRPQLTNLTLGKLIDLKAEWRVSMQALFERAYRLGMVTSGERTVFYRNLSRRGWKLREPNSENLPPEVPQLAASMGRRLSEAGLDENEIATLIGMAPGASSPFLAQRRALRALQ